MIGASILPGLGGEKENPPYKWITKPVIAIILYEPDRLLYFMNNFGLILNAP
jgi:hypothetical protein